MCVRERCECVCVGGGWGKGPLNRLYIALDFSSRALV